MIDGILMGALGGALADKVGDQIDTVAGAPQPEKHVDCIHADIHIIRDSLLAMVQAQKLRADISHTIVIPLAPNYIRLNRHNRAHSYIFFTNATTALTLDIPGIGIMTFTPSSGWTQLDLPDSTGISVTSGNATNAIYMCSDVQLDAPVI